MNFCSLIEMDIDISGVPVTKILPMSKKPTKAIVFYHGFSSSRKNTLFRGRILASMGYLVLLPEAIGHGVRVDELDIDFTSFNKLWDVIITNITESPNLINYLCEKEEINPKDITIMGHSMGAMSAAGIFTKLPYGSLVMFNGSLDFMGLLDYYRRNSSVKEEIYSEMKNKIQYYSPAKFLSKLENRPIIMIDGDRDRLVPPTFNEHTFEILKPFYKNKDLIQHVIIPLSSHKMTVHSMEIAIDFIEKEVQ